MKTKAAILLMLIYGAPLTMAAQSPENVAKYQRIVSMGLPAYYSTNAEYRQYLFLKACEQLGDFYAKQFAKGKLKTNDKAIETYTLAAKENYGTDTNLYDARRNINVLENVCRKLGDLFLHGKGTKVDKQKAFFYHTKILMEKKEAKFYSKKYFGSYQKIYDLNTQLVTIVPNPFENDFSIADFKNVARIRDAKHRLDSAKNLIIEIYATVRTHYEEWPCYKIYQTWNTLKSYLVTDIDIVRVVYPDDQVLICGNGEYEFWLGGILVDGITLSFEYQK